ncbi:hypothetical protein [Chitinophaga sp. LS1]|uniref:hypothetical protein n=1 Tax=Chitinophaga sp. LS1 TaxID=3051176 RepID=UPI002AAAAA4B|nr:hypothetical protein [Chitinophaga sp. LS1]WPV70582.1 hypothetical protein QQL36_17880 [Chitinophaga sp. LS1]
MSKKTSNRYAKKAQQTHYQAIARTLDTKGDLKNSVIETGKELLIGVLGGGLLGSAIGKPSLLIGIGVTGLGHFVGNKAISLLGVGMMAANGFQTQSSVSGVEDDSLLGFKDRVVAFKDTFSQKLYIDKFIKNKTGTAASTVSGIGGLQYFNYANEIAGIEGLNAIEDQVENSAMSRLQLQGGVGVSPDYNFPGIEGPIADLSDLGDVSDYNL